MFDFHIYFLAFRIHQKILCGVLYSIKPLWSEYIYEYFSYFQLTSTPNWSSLSVISNYNHLNRIQFKIVAKAE
jgi:hypothetical protein